MRRLPASPAHPQSLQSFLTPRLEPRRERPRLSAAPLRATLRPGTPLIPDPPQPILPAARAPGLPIVDRQARGGIAAGSLLGERGSKAAAARPPRRMGPVAGFFAPDASAFLCRSRTRIRAASAQLVRQGARCRWFKRPRSAHSFGQSGPGRPVCSSSRTHASAAPSTARPGRALASRRSGIRMRAFDHAGISCPAFSKQRLTLTRFQPPAAIAAATPPGRARSRAATPASARPLASRGSHRTHGPE